MTHAYARCLQAQAPQNMAARREEAEMIFRRESDTLCHAGRLRSELAFGRIDEILATGLHADLSQFWERVTVLGGRISREFLMPQAT